MLALIAGAGRLPAEIAAAQEARPLVCAYEGHAPDGLEIDVTYRIETLGSLIRDLTGRGVQAVCFAGGITRPVFDPSRIDAQTQPLIPALQDALSQGDDGSLRRIAALFEARGMQVRGAHELAPHLLPPEGVLTQAQPDEAAKADAVRGAGIVAAMSGADIGQACAVLRKQALAVEGVFGTDWMLASLAARPDDGGGVFYKALKPDQDIRFDMPAIGPDTVAGVVRAGLRGIVVQAGGVMVLEREAVVAACDAAGLFLWVRGSCASS